MILLPIKITIFVGDVSETTSSVALALDKEAVLLDQSNYLQFLNKELLNHTFYTSLGDLPKDIAIMYRILDKADDIIYCPTNSWSDDKALDITNVTSSIQGLTEFILFNISQIKHNVYNLDLTKYTNSVYTILADSRKTDSQQLWISGCSVTHGVGVDASQRYGQLLANLLELPVSFLTAGGSSIPWAIDQIIRSDVCPGDIVVLGLISEFRFPYWAGKNGVWHIASSHRLHAKKLPFTNLSHSMLDRLITDENCFYQSVISINQLINFCRKLNLKLLILGLLSSHKLALQLSNISQFKNYVNFESPNSYVDLGTDDKHPGPQQHKLYADFCQSALKQLHYI